MNPDKPMSVLVVDDNKDAADTLSAYLRLQGCAVRVVYDGREAVRAAAADPPDGVVLDIGVPGLDGLEGARKLRAAPATRRVPLVAWTGYADDRMRGEALAAGFDRHLA